MSIIKYILVFILFMTASCAYGDIPSGLMPYFIQITSLIYQPLPYIRDYCSLSGPYTQCNELRDQLHDSGTNITYSFLETINALNAISVIPETLDSLYKDELIQLKDNHYILPQEIYDDIKKITDLSSAELLLNFSKSNLVNEIYDVSEGYVYTYNNTWLTDTGFWTELLKSSSISNAKQIMNHLAYSSNTSISIENVSSGIAYKKSKTSASDHTMALYRKKLAQHGYIPNSDIPYFNKYILQTLGNMQIIKDFINDCQTSGQDFATNMLLVKVEQMKNFLTSNNLFFLYLPSFDEEKLSSIWNQYVLSVNQYFSILTTICLDTLQQLLNTASFTIDNVALTTDAFQQADHLYTAVTSYMNELAEYLIEDYHFSKIVLQKIFDTTSSVNFTRELHDTRYDISAFFTAVQSISSQLNLQYQAPVVYDIAYKAMPFYSYAEDPIYGLYSDGLRSQLFYSSLNASEKFTQNTSVSEDRSQLDSVKKTFHFGILPYVVNFTIQSYQQDPFIFNPCLKSNDHSAYVSCLENNPHIYDNMTFAVKEYANLISGLYNSYFYEYALRNLGNYISHYTNFSVLPLTEYLYKNFTESTDKSGYFYLTQYLLYSVKNSSFYSDFDNTLPYNYNRRVEPLSFFGLTSDLSQLVSILQTISSSNGTHFKSYDSNSIAKWSSSLGDGFNRILVPIFTKTLAGLGYTNLEKPSSKFFEYNVSIASNSHLIDYYITSKTHGNLSADDLLNQTLSRISYPFYEISNRLEALQSKETKDQNSSLSSAHFKTYADNLINIHKKLASKVLFGGIDTLNQEISLMKNETALLDKDYLKFTSALSHLLSDNATINKYELYNTTIVRALSGLGHIIPTLNYTTINDTFTNIRYDIASIYNIINSMSIYDDKKFYEASTKTNLSAPSFKSFIQNYGSGSSIDSSLKADSQVSISPNDKRRIDKIIIGSVVGGILFLLLILAIIFIYTAKSRSSSSV